MSRLARNSANKKHNIPDFKVLGNISLEITQKINDLVTEKKANEVINIIDYINSFVKAKITNVSVDTWNEAFDTDWKRSGDYSTPTCAIFLVTNGSASVHVDKDQYEMSSGQLCIVNEWCTHKLVNKSSAPLTMLLAQFIWDHTKHEK